MSPAGNLISNVNACPSTAALHARTVQPKKQRYIMMRLQQLRAYPAHRRSNGRQAQDPASQMPVCPLQCRGARSCRPSSTGGCPSARKSAGTISSTQHSAWSGGGGGGRSGAAPCAVATSAGNPKTSKAHCAQQCAPAFRRRCRGRLTALRRSPPQQQTLCKAEGQTPRYCNTAWRPLYDEARKFPANKASTEKARQAVT